jgi:hypothetical protein
MMTTTELWKDYRLHFDQIAAWIKSEWIPHHQDATYEILWTTPNILLDLVYRKLDRKMDFKGWRFVDFAPIDCPVVHPVNRRNDNNSLAQRTGAYVFHFEPIEQNGANQKLEVLGIVAQVSDTCSWERVELACVPVAHTAVWTAFCVECNRLAYERDAEVIVVGGRVSSFVPRVNWEDVILPATLKTDILNNIQGFFDKGVAIYRQLNLNPFRKLLFAGVPGTGKTMLCVALAKWGLSRRYRVIYVSSAQRAQGEHRGATFDKVQRALDIAARSDRPALIILEELDAYLHTEEKALILNVLDGSESEMNPHGTLLLATTNYPEAIDERVLKRPGRLDRIYIIPEARTEADAEAMLRRYLNVNWRDEHLPLIPALTGYPGAFIREVALQALTRMASEDLPTLTLEVIQESFEHLKLQITERDVYMVKRDKTQNGGSRQPETSAELPKTR